MATQNGVPVKLLAKPEVLKNSKAQLKLKPFQDEKRDKYQYHMDIAGDVFEDARRARAQMNTEYEQRTKLIHDKINEINKRNDAATQELNNTLKSYSNAFDEGMAARKHAWKAELKAGTEILSKRIEANEEEEIRLDGLIKAEHEACKEHTQQGIGPILEKLQQHRDSIAKTKKERELKNRVFENSLAANVERLRKLLSEEARARSKACLESHAKTKAIYSELNAKQREQTKATLQRLEELKNLIDKEQQDTKNSNTWVTHEMMQFMEHFEINVRGAVEKQEAAKAHLKGLKDVFK